MIPLQNSCVRRTRSRTKLLATLIGLTILASVTITGVSQETASAQSDGDTTMLLFDLSGSMDRTAPDGRTRLENAQSAMIQAIGALTPGSTNIGIRSFSDCGVSNLERAPAPVDAASLATTINSFTTDAATDIANALRSVANDFGGTTGRKSVILLSDGLDNCGGDPCATASALIAAGIDIIVNAIGIGTAGTAAETQLACIASVTGGTVVSVESADDLFDALDDAISGGATSAVVRSTGTVCINSTIVQSNPDIQSLSVGDTYTDGTGNQLLLISGETCGYDCNDGFDMNCDGILGDFCASNRGRTTVAGAGECTADTDADLIDQTEEAVEPNCSGMTLIECYAPEVRFHPREEFFPMDPLDFIDGSTLTWVNDADGILRTCPGDEQIHFRPNPARLGQGRYTWQQKEFRVSFTEFGCYHFGPEYNTSQFTRPFDAEPGNTSAGSRPNNGDGNPLETQDGFVLEWAHWLEGGGVWGLDNNPGAGGQVDAPMFAQLFQSPEYGRAIVYHMFYGYDPKSRFFGDGATAHEGDWERIIVILGSDDIPTEVRFEGHGCSGPEFAAINYVPWTNMSTDPQPPTTPGTGHLVGGTHPVVYVAQGSHASYPYLRPRGDKACQAITALGVEIINSGEMDDTVFTDQSATWRPWETGQLLDPQSECWYGFGGGWGDTGSNASLIGRADDTGPAGPHWNINGLPEGNLCPGLFEVVTEGLSDDLGYGDTFGLSLSGFTPESQVIASLASVEVPVAVAVVGADGTGRISFTMPDGFEPGPHDVIVRDVASGELLSISHINVVPPAECLIAGTGTGTSATGDIDGDNLLDACDRFLTTGPAADFDGDGIINLDDNCPRVPNPDQAGFSRAPIGFACDVKLGHNPARQLFLELTSPSVVANAIPATSRPAVGNFVPLNSIPVSTAGGLAHTGAETVPLAALGLNLVALGLAALGISRVRRLRPSHSS